MPSDYLDLVRECYDAFERGDLDYVIARSAADIEVVEAPDLPGSQTYRGHDGLAEAIQNWVGEWEDFRLDVERMIDAGNQRVITLVRHHGRGKSSGVPVESRWVYLHTGSEGKIVRWEIFGRLDDAFAAIGLRRLKGET
jgi:uncharacterized protein